MSLKPLLEGLLAQLSQTPGVQAPETVDDCARAVLRILIETHQEGGTELATAMTQVLDTATRVFEMCLEEWSARTPRMGAAVEKLLEALSNIDDPRLKTLDVTQAMTVVSAIQILRSAANPGETNHAQK